MPDLALKRSDGRVVVDFLRDHVDDLQLVCLGEGPSPSESELLAETVSTIVGRYLDPLRPTAELTPFGLCAALNGLDMLEDGVFRLLRPHGGKLEALETLRAVELAIAETRSEYLRSYQNRMAHTSVLERIPDSLFIVSADRGLGALTSGGKPHLAGQASQQCFEAFFDRNSQCPECPLDEVLEGQKHGRCPRSRRKDHPHVGLSPLASDRALAYVFGGKRTTQDLDPASDGTRREALDNLASGVLFTDAADRIIYANSVAKEYFGTNLEGHAVGTVVPPTCNQQDGSSTRIRLTLASGTESILSARCVSATLDGVPGSLLTFRDITEHERMRKEMSRMRRLSDLGEMAAVVAHEIRNPLAGIMATIQSIDSQAEAAGLGEHFGLVQREVKRLADLLSEFSVIVHHRPARRRPTDVRMLVDTALRLAKPWLRDVNVRTKYRNLKKVPVDPTQVQQLLQNLIVNACDAMRNDGRLDIEVERAREMLTIRVTDTGAGIAPDLLEKVLEAFFTTKPTGTGLGLSICDRIATAHGGSLSIDSTEGQGTQVTIQLALA